MLLITIQARIDKAKDAYLREVAAVDRELQGVVRVDASHLKAAVAVQKTFTVEPPVLELKANEQPDDAPADVQVDAAETAPPAATPAATKTPKAKRPRTAKSKK